MEYAATLGLFDIAYQPPGRARPVDQWGMAKFRKQVRLLGLGIR